MMMVRYARVRPADHPRSGEVVSIGSCVDRDFLAQDRPDAAVVDRPLPVDGGWRYLWATDEWVERPVMAVALDKSAIAADGVDAATISGIPEGAAIETGSGRYVAGQDGVHVFRSRVPGRYVARVRAFPYRDAELTIEVG